MKNYARIFKDELIDGVWKTTEEEIARFDTEEQAQKAIREMARDMHTQVTVVCGHEFIKFSDTVEYNWCVDVEMTQEEYDALSDEEKELADMGFFLAYED